MTKRATCLFWQVANPDVLSRRVVLLNQPAGVARGAIAAKASSVTSGMFLAAAERLAQEVTKEDLAVGSVFPRTIDTLGDTARSVGVAVVRRAKQDGVAELDRNVAALVAV